MSYTSQCTVMSKIWETEINFFDFSHRHQPVAISTHKHTSTHAQTQKSQAEVGTSEEASSGVSFAPHRTRRHCDAISTVDIHHESTSNEMKSIGNTSVAASSEEHRNEPVLSSNTRTMGPTAGKLVASKYSRATTSDAIMNKKIPEYDPRTFFLVFNERSLQRKAVCPILQFKLLHLHIDFYE